MTTTDNIDDRPQRLQRPELRGDPITATRYTSRDYFAAELDNVWRRTWNIAGVAYQAPEEGDYLVAEVGPESVIVVRRADGSFNGYLNVCPHRGARVAEGPYGFADRFVCPYHGWQFDLDGRVVDLPDPQDFKAGNPCSKLGLEAVVVTELFGMVWFNIDRDCESLEDYLGATIVEEISGYHIEEMVRVLDMTAETECNWKILTDNFNEAYHLQVVHPQLVPFIESQGDFSQIDLMPNGHNRGWFASYQPSALHEGPVVEPLPSLLAEWDVAVPENPSSEVLRQLRKDVQDKKRKLGPERGFDHYAYLKNYQLTDYVIYNIFPNSVITVGPDGVQLLRPRPHATDPAQCLFDHWWLVPKIGGRTHTPSPSGGPDLPVEDAEHEYFAYGEQSLGETADQDLSIGALQQQGLGSVGFKQFYLSEQEIRLQNFHERLDDHMRRDTN